MARVEILEKTAAVYDITVEDNHNFFANGILVHNCLEILQNATPMGTYSHITHLFDMTDEDDLALFHELSNRKDVVDCTVLGEKSGKLKIEFKIDESRIPLCTLSAINFGNIKKPEDFEKPCMLAIRGLDALLSYQHYPVLAAEMHTREYRPLGVGINNLAYWMAKNAMTYSNPNLEMIDEYMEAWSYYLIKASADLAVEYGKCEKNENTKYGNGILPIDTYKKDVDDLVANNLKMPWEDLRNQIKEHGIRNATTSCVMPSETSSQLINATNGVEPPRSYVSTKVSKDGVLKQVVPEIRNLKNKYELLWDQKSPRGYLSIMAVIMKYCDQAVSTNTSYNPRFYPDEKLPMSELLGDLLYCYKYGLPTLYYFNTNDGQGEVNIDEILPEEEMDEENCDSCVL